MPAYPPANEQPTTRSVYTVSVASQRIRKVLAGEFPRLWIRGEVSNLVRSAAGHWYFTLKDDAAQLRCAMFRNRAATVRHPVANGDEIIVFGRIDLYEARGDLQLIAELLEPAGLGALQARFEAIKQKLLSEGLFDSAIKRPVPRYPSRIGIVTSPTGAAIHDILTVLQRRAPGVRIDLYPSLVQGSSAAASIVAAIELANRCQRADILIVGRGGGSLEDLWPFNEEAVARAVRASSIAVVSAVGHEVDFTITDMAADLRAPTPSAAAELVSAGYVEARLELNRTLQRLVAGIERLSQRLQHELHALGSRIRHPGERLERQFQRLDSVHAALQSQVRWRLERPATKLSALSGRLTRQHPRVRIASTLQRLEQLRLRTARSAAGTLERRRHHLDRQGDLLAALNPLRVLDRGFAVVSKSGGEVVRSPEQLHANDPLEVRVSGGRFGVRVDEDPRS